jgi:hypothetical protein
MNFPSFVQTGPTADIPVAPMQYPPVNFLPAIQMLMEENKKEKASTAKATKDSEYKIKGTIGQISQWERERNKVYNKIQAGMEFYGPEVFTSRPEYTKLTNELERFDSNEMSNTAEENLKSLDAYKAQTKGNSGAINIEAMQKFGTAMAHEDWQEVMGNAETEGIGRTRAGAYEWKQNFPFSPQTYGPEDAAEAMRATFAAAGNSSFGWSDGKDYMEEAIIGNTMGVLSTYNKTIEKYSSNYNKRGEGPDEEGRGQLGIAKQQAMQRGFMNIDVTDKLSAGFMQGFLQQTVGHTGTTGAKGTHGKRKEALLRRFNATGSRTEKEDDELSKTHDGYYFGKGNEREGQIDEDLFMKDFREYGEFFMETQLGLEKDDTYDKDTDNKQSFVASPDEAYKARAAKKEAEDAVKSATQINVTSPTTTISGFTEDELDAYFTQAGFESEGGDGGFFDEIFVKGDWSNLAETNNGTTTEDAFTLAAKQGSMSPLSTVIDANGVQRFTVNENFDPANSGPLLESMQKRYEINGLTSTAAKDKAEADLSKLMIATNKIKLDQAYYAQYGQTREQGVAYTWMPQSVNKSIIEVYDRVFNPEKTGDVVTYKTFNDFSNSPIIIGETAGNSQSLLGNMKILSTTNDLSMRATVMAGNYGFRATGPTMIGGDQYYEGDFVPMSKIDALTPEQAAEMTKPGSNLQVGAGLWTVLNGKAKISKNSAGKFIAAVPDFTTTQDAGKTAIHIASDLHTSGDGQDVMSSPIQYFTTVVAGGNKDDWNAQVKEWEKKGTTVAVETSVVKGVSEKELNATKTEASGLTKNIKHDNLEKTADALGLKGKLREEYIQESNTNIKGLNPYDVRKYRQDITNAKYLSAKKGGNGRDWKVEVQIAKVPIVKGGKVDPRHMEALGVVTDVKGNFKMNVQMHATGAVDQSVGGRNFKQASGDLFYEGTTKQKSKVVQQQPTTAKPGVNPRSK